jgi:hypothetical protein
MNTAVDVLGHERCQQAPEDEHGRDDLQADGGPARLSLEVGALVKPSSYQRHALPRHGRHQLRMSMWMHMCVARFTALDQPPQGDHSSRPTIEVHARGCFRHERNGCRPWGAQVGTPGTAHHVSQCIATLKGLLAFKQAPSKRPRSSIRSLGMARP